jgi:hypothetical protein
MGIKEAEVILSSRPELDHAYQNRFLNEKMASSGDLSRDLPTVEQTLNQGAERQVERQIEGPLLPREMKESLQTQAQTLGFGEDFQVRGSLAQDVTAHIQSEAQRASASKEDLKQRGSVKQEKMTRKTQ